MSDLNDLFKPRFTMNLSNQQKAERIIGLIRSDIYQGDLPYFISEKLLIEDIVNVLKKFKYNIGNGDSPETAYIHAIAIYVERNFNPSCVDEDVMTEIIGKLVKSLGIIDMREEYPAGFDVFKKEQLNRYPRNLTDLSSDEFNMLIGQLSQKWTLLSPQEKKVYYDDVVEYSIEIRQTAIDKLVRNKLFRHKLFMN